MSNLKKVGLAFQTDGQAEMVKSMKEINAELKQNDYHMQKLKHRWDESTSTKKKLTDQLDYAQRAYSLNEQKARQLSRELTELEKDEKANAGAIAEKKRELERAEKEMAFYEGRIKKVSERLERGGLHIEDYGRKLQGVGGKVKDAGKKLSILSGVVTGVGAFAAKTGIEFEKAMSEVASVSGATSEEMEVLEKAAREAGASTEKSAKEAADALQYMALAGWDVNESTQALMPVLKLSSAAKMDLGRASDLVTDTMSVLGLEIDDLNGYLDILAQTSRNSNTDVDDLGEAFLAVGGRLRSLGVDAEEGAVALGILADNGIKGSSAGKSLNAILANLTAPTGRAKKALDELNISAFDSQGQFIGVEETLKLVDEATRDLTDEQKNMYLSMIGGKEHTAALLNLMDGLGDGFDNLGEKVRGAEGALEEMYDKAIDNTLGSLNELKSSMDDLAITIFKNMKPAIDWLVEKAQALVDWMNSLDEETQQLVTVIGMVVAVLGPVILILGTIIEKVGIILELFAPLIAKLGGVIAKIGSIGEAVAAAAGISTGALGLIVAAVVALAYIVYKNWDEIKEWTLNLIDTMKEKWNQFKEWFMDLWTNLKNWFTEKFTSVKDWFIETFQSIYQPIADTINKITDFFKNVGLLIVAVFAMGLEKIWNFFEPFVNKVKEWIGTLSNYITETFNKVRDIIIRIVERIKNAWQTGISYIRNNIIAPLSAFFSGVFNRIWNTVSSVIDKIRSGFSRMGDAVKRIFLAIRDTVVNVFSAIGGIIKAPINGVIRAINGALKAMNKIKVPKWVPGFGGKGINFSLIPMLAKGGNLLGGSAIVGEAGPELLTTSGSRATVTPLTDGGGAKPREIIDYDKLAQANMRALAMMFNEMEVKLDERQVGRFVRKTLKGAV